MTCSSNDLEVAAPDIRSSLIVGATIGGWFRNRETPIFVAVHGSISPFVRTTEGKMTYEAGVLFGIYVPLLDFN